MKDKEKVEDSPPQWVNSVVEKLLEVIPDNPIVVHSRAWLPNSYFTLIYSSTFKVEVITRPSLDPPVEMVSISMFSNTNKVTKFGVLSCTVSNVERYTAFESKGVEFTEEEKELWLKLWDIVLREKDWKFPQIILPAKE